MLLQDGGGVVGAPLPRVTEQNNVQDQYFAEKLSRMLLCMAVDDPFDITAWVVMQRG